MLLIKDSAFGKYGIAQDSMGFTTGIIVSKKNKEGEQEERLNNVSHFSSVESAIKNIIKRRLADQDDTVTLREYLDEYKAIKEQIEEALKEIKL